MIRGMRRRPIIKAIAMGLMGDLGLMGWMGLMGVVVVSLLLAVSVWVVWWLRVVAARSVVLIFSRSRLVVRRVVSWVWWLRVIMPKTAP